MRTQVYLSPLLVTLGFAAQPAFAQAPSNREQAALTYLALEVPLWKTDNGCYSCHNNGDGARALYTARLLGYDVPDEALEDTTRWLAAPLAWDENRGDPEFSDKKLARIQFAAALAAAVRAGLAPSKTLTQAAESLLPDQEADGSWQVDARGTVGSPITYGAALATYMARSVLKSAVSPSLAQPIDRADRWFAVTPPKTVLDASATLLALADTRPEQGVSEQRSRALALLTDSQAGDGGWGPYPNSPSEPFDTALALLALNSLAGSADYEHLIRHGREFLIAAQLDPGGWLETTRPPGSQSYAQHISTTAWATLALLATREVEK